MQAWRLMPNHVHLIAVPQTISILGRSIGEAHRRYTRHISLREDWRGYLWRDRFFRKRKPGPKGSRDRKN